MSKHIQDFDRSCTLFLQFLQFTAICQEAKARGSHVLVGVHSDQTLQLGVTVAPVQRSNGPTVQLYPDLCLERDCFWVCTPKRNGVFGCFYVGGSRNGGTTLAGWFTRENPNLKRMITGTPAARNEVFGSKSHEDFATRVGRILQNRNVRLDRDFMGFYGDLMVV